MFKNRYIYNIKNGRDNETFYFTLNKVYFENTQNISFIIITFKPIFILLLMLHSYLFTGEIELDNWTIQVEKTIIYET